MNVQPVGGALRSVPVRGVSRKHTPRGIQVWVDHHNGPFNFPFVRHHQALDRRVPTKGPPSITAHTNGQIQDRTEMRDRIMRMAAAIQAIAHGSCDGVVHRPGASVKLEVNQTAAQLRGAVYDAPPCQLAQHPNNPSRPSAPTDQERVFSYSMASDHGTTTSPSNETPNARPCEIKLRKCTGASLGRLDLDQEPHQTPSSSNGTPKPQDTHACTLPGFSKVRRMLPRRSSVRPL